jgi:hypothetical protein
MSGITCPRTCQYDLGAGRHSSPLAPKPEDIIAVVTIITIVVGFEFDARVHRLKRFCYMPISSASVTMAKQNCHQIPSICLDA